MVSRRDRYGEGITRLVGHALLADMRLPPASDGIDGDGIMARKLDRDRWLRGMRRLRDKTGEGQKRQ